MMTLIIVFLHGNGNEGFHDSVLHGNGNYYLYIHYSILTW